MRTFISRREAIREISLITTGFMAASGSQAFAQESPAKTGMGLVIYDCGIRRKWMQQQNPEFDLFEPLNFLEHCRKLGAGGMQARLDVLDDDQAKKIRGFAEQHSLYIEAIVSPPTGRADVERFDAEIKTAVSVGAKAARTVIMPGRRYEQFKSIDEVRAAATKGELMLELAKPFVEKHRLPLAVENHKDQRIDDRVALFKRLDSEFIGATVDTGNSFALLDDPYEAVEALAPYAFSVHLKDQAVLEYGEGFLLGDIPLGQGCFDLKRMVASLRVVKPKIDFSLELITRDPLKVTCLTEKYWATLPEVPGSDLARTLQIVRQHPAKELQQVSNLSLEQQVVLEDANVAASLKYAREALGL